MIGEHACHGGTGAAPIARAVIKKYLEKYFPEQYGEKVLASRLKSMGQNYQVPKPSKVEALEDEGYADGGNPELTPEIKIPLAAPAPPMPITPAEALSGPDASPEDSGATTNSNDSEE